MGYTRTVDRKKENKSTHGAEIAKYTQRLCLRKEVWWWSGICFHLDLLVVGEEKTDSKSRGQAVLWPFPVMTLHVRIQWVQRRELHIDAFSTLSDMNKKWQHLVSPRRKGVSSYRAERQATESLSPILTRVSFQTTDLFLHQVQRDLLWWALMVFFFSLFLSLFLPYSLSVSPFCGQSREERAGSGVGGVMGCVGLFIGARPDRGEAEERKRRGQVAEGRPSPIHYNASVLSWQTRSPLKKIGYLHSVFLKCWGIFDFSKGYYSTTGKLQTIHFYLSVLYSLHTLLYTSTCLLCICSMEDG